MDLAGTCYFQRAELRQAVRSFLEGEEAHAAALAGFPRLEGPLWEQHAPVLEARVGELVAAATTLLAALSERRLAERG